ncbi:hypothetical protein BTW15_27885 [Pseudomonas syringae pv. tomato]|uniref:Uncharacterized protein n=2 Tax=Pseudomonas syringae group genomosp. 3 TaxID=251701 RepID=A0AB36KJJ7_PSEUB|nr:hypothetical protein XJ28_08145 [Pseudomonas syringae pv. tomato]KPW29245.1 hypothetical protein ALO87_101909 [Pseudomonas syringae pv. apii]KPW44218.1 hypothetical protein ALO88_102094 [Pseudomonas syringae pv. antirrhini]KPW61318.1 hypothetical protein ALO86_101639 [Pseudomonas syringae pv. berberidis]KPY23186.1 hypothetical protein ALO54_101853 [Pseudomonas syringae pv. philadelphi]POQ06594.1 hypothetical protein CXB40_19785 [Pseudomonas syringae pv. avii]QBI64590.1 hypothetical protein
MAVTAYRPLVVSRMAYTAEVRNESEYAIPEQISQLLDQVKQSGLAKSAGCIIAKLRRNGTRHAVWVR